MKFVWGLILFLSVAAGCALTGLALAYQINFGALIEDTVLEDTVSFGAMRRSTLSRRVIQIPQSYGRLITITTSNTGTTLWFESQEGLIRNVSLVGAVPLVIERKGELN